MKKISPQALKKAWRIWFFWHGSSQQGENLLGNATAHSLSPIIEELYDTKEEKSAAYKRGLTLFNTEQQLGAIAPGIICGTEEAVANKQIVPEVADAIKVALIGPTSAIGDSLWVAIIIPLLLTICMTITNLGGPFLYLGPALYLAGYPLLTWQMSWYLWQKGYHLGIEGIGQFMKSGQIEKVTQAMTVLGLIVVGGLAASFISASVPVSIIPPGGETAAIQLDDLINRIFPKLLPLCLAYMVYWLYSKKKKSPLYIMGIILLIALLFTGLGYLSGNYAL